MTQPTSSGQFSQQDHADLAPRSSASADLLVPLVLQLTHAQSVVDVGCGTGVGHINERWLSHWASLFEEHGYLPLDALRPQTWHRSEIAWWYRQNLMLFVRQHRYISGKEALGHLLSSVARRIGFR